MKLPPLHFTLTFQPSNVPIMVNTDVLLVHTQVVQGKNASNLLSLAVQIC